MPPRVGTADVPRRTESQRDGRENEIEAKKRRLDPSWEPMRTTSVSPERCYELRIRRRMQPLVSSITEN